MSRTIQVMLEYFYPWTNSAGIYQARRAGYYAEAGLDVQIRLYDPFVGDTLTYLAAGQVDFGIFPTNRLFVLNERDPQVVGVAAINQRGMETIQTVRGKGIEKPADLAGKRIALNPTVRGLAMVRHLLRANGVDPDDWTIVDSGLHEVLAEEIAEGEFDATFGTYWAWDVLLDESLPAAERLIWPVDEIGAPKYLSYLLGTPRKLLDAEPELIRDFLAATRRGYLDVAADPASAQDLYATATPWVLPHIIEKSLPLIASSWLNDGAWGLQDDEYQDSYGNWLLANGILHRPGSWHEAYTNELVS
jgi:NitT/TauT family transport system substrate-binding protein